MEQKIEARITDQGFKVLLIVLSVFTITVKVISLINHMNTWILLTLTIPVLILCFLVTKNEYLMSVVKVAAIFSIVSGIAFLLSTGIKLYIGNYEDIDFSAVISRAGLLPLGIYLYWGSDKYILLEYQTMDQSENE